MADTDTFTWNATLMEWEPALPLSVSMECACANLTNSTDPCFAVRADGDFNLGLHVGSIFIILAASLLGVILPLIIAAIPSTPMAFRKLLYYGKFFGSGVILSTGFVHIFPDACSTLQQPCLPQWFQDFAAAPGLFALIGVLGMHLMEMAANYFVHKFQHRKRGDTSTETPENINGGDSVASLDSEPKLPNEEEVVESEHDEEHTHSLLVVSDQTNWTTALLLEFGISVHSVIIGISLGTAGDEFAALLIALSFHQFFEGLGLGNVLAEAQMSTKKKDRTMTRAYATASALFYAMTTPVGIAIGIGISYNDSTASIIATGILDSLSSGILIYAALVSLISVVFQTRTFKSQPMWQKSICFLAFYLGAGLMSMLAIWA